MSTSHLIMIVRGDLDFHRLAGLACCEVGPMMGPL